MTMMITILKNLTMALYFRSIKRLHFAARDCVNVGDIVTERTPDKRG